MVSSPGAKHSELGAGEPRRRDPKRWEDDVAGEVVGGSGTAGVGQAAGVELDRGALGPQRLL